ncbi:BCCT transporter family protein, partial [Acinetobacter baumannii 342950]|uniref:BCCT family transporter n=4 Tax=Gammaproteobacteria TaxID=1236 RepID=UPI000449A9A6
MATDNPRAVDDLTLSKSKKDPLNRVVFYISALIILIFSLVTFLFNDFANRTINTVLAWVTSTFGWYYLLAATLYMVFVIFIACSRYGEIKLGPKHSKPEFSLLSWSAMLFSAGIGIALLYYGVAEPVDHFLRPPEGEAGTIQAARNAMTYSFLHWGIHGWVLYALLGVTLGYFAFRQDLPLALRSALYPIFGERVHGLVGDFVDGFGILATVISLVTNS